MDWRCFFGRHDWERTLDIGYRYCKRCFLAEHYEWTGYGWCWMPILYERRPF